MGIARSILKLFPIDGDLPHCWWWKPTCEVHMHISANDNKQRLTAPFIDPFWFCQEAQEVYIYIYIYMYMIIYDCIWLYMYIHVPYESPS